MEKRNLETAAQTKMGRMLMSCIQAHHSSDVPSITSTIMNKQNSVLTLQWRGAKEGEGVRWGGGVGKWGMQGGKLGNQM